jgi:polyisoprenoid-binding protein YceI
VVRILLAALGLALAGASPATAAKFVVKPGNPNQVVFVSQAPTEKFEGKTNQMEGWLALNTDGIEDSITVHLEVDLASLDTGIAKRNQHMRENHLETAKYPTAMFDGATVRVGAGARLDSGAPVKFEAEGTFSLHHVSRRIRVPIIASYVAGKQGGRIAFSTSFPVSLPDYSISRPQFLFMKLAEVQQVRVSGVGTLAP